MRASIQNYLLDLREAIIAAFEKFEEGNATFTRKPWQYQKGQGGGEIAVLHGKVFEKAAVNFSAIQGDSFPMQDGSGPFFATGVSLITHMANPHAPTVHMNLRFIEAQDKSWLGGGYDLTPMGQAYEEDTKHFHGVAEKTLGPELYASFSQNAKEYFYIPHRAKERGVGGIFFDHFGENAVEASLPVWKAIGNTFLEAIIPIYKKRAPLPFTPEQRELQLELRAHYVEFNLLYDRGTKFGFFSGGNPEAILCSMPPLAKW